MNILKKEFKMGWKSFLLWSIGLVFLMFAGMAKFSGISETSDVNISELMNQFPPIVLSVLGMSGLDVSTLGGYYAILVYYALICAAVYGLSLGNQVVNREAIDRTYEFLFTKPRSRSRILYVKLQVAFFYLVLFSLLNYVFSMAAVSILKEENTIQEPIFLFSVSLFLTGILFCMIGAFISVIIKDVEKGALYGNLFFVTVFIVGLVYDSLEGLKLLWVFAPLKYFSSAQILEGHLEAWPLIFLILLSIVLGMAVIHFFEAKDFSY